MALLNNRAGRLVTLGNFQRALLKPFGSYSIRANTLAAKSGYTLSELLGEAEEQMRKVGKPVAVKYRHPKDEALAWTGRGRQPKWVVEFLAAGGTIEQLSV